MKPKQALAEPVSHGLVGRRTPVSPRVAACPATRSLPGTVGDAKSTRVGVVSTPRVADEAVCEIQHTSLWKLCGVVEKRASRDGGLEIRDKRLGIGTHAIIRIGGDANGGVEMRTKGLCCGKRVHGGLPTTYSTWC